MTGGRRRGGHAWLGLLVLAWAPSPVVGQSGVHEVEMRSLDNGAQLIVAPGLDTARVAVRLLLRGGTSADPPRLAGLASLTAQVLTHSTRSRTEEELSRSLGSLDARLAAVADLDYSTVALSAPPEALDDALDLMADVVMDPVIPADRLAATVARARNAIEAAWGSPAFQASRAFVRSVYGDHPYGLIETAETLSRIDVQDAVRYHRDFYRPNNAIFVVSGTSDVDRVAASLERAFSGWPPGQLSLPTYHGLPDRNGRDVELLHIPGARTAVVRAGLSIPAEAGPDWGALRLANRVLGADGAARLAGALGSLAPEVRSTMIRRADVGEFQVRFEVETDSLGRALEIMLDEIDALGRRGPSALEVEARKGELLAEMQSASDDPARTADKVTQQILLGAPNGGIAESRNRIASLEPGDVRDAVARYLAVGRMVIVVAGDATALQDRVSTFGPVTLLDPAGSAWDRAELDAHAARLSLDGSSLRPGTWSYRVDAQDWPVGQVTRRLLVGDEEGTLRLESDAQVGPRRVQRSVTFRARTFTPVTSEDRLEAEGRRFSSDLTVADGRVSGAYRSPAGERPVDAAAPPGSLLGEMAEAALWVADLARGEEFTLPILSQDGSTASVRARVRGERRVSVPAGTFDTWEVELVGAGQNQRIYVTRERPRFTVKIELVDQPVVTVLTQVLEEP